MNHGVCITRNRSFSKRKLDWDKNQQHPNSTQRSPVLLIISPPFPHQADDAEEHGEWHIVNMERNITETIEDHGNFSDITVAISLSRRPQFYVMNIIVPCLIIYCLTLFSFCLPCDSGEKVRKVNTNVKNNQRTATPQKINWTQLNILYA